MNKGLEYIRNQITKLKDDLQHYTMVEKDQALVHQIKYDLENLFGVEKELKALEIIKEKCVNTRYLFYIIGYQGLDYEEYKESYSEYSDVLLTQEEYELLKEILVCH